MRATRTIIREPGHMGINVPGRSSGAGSIWRSEHPDQRKACRLAEVAHKATLGGRARPFGNCAIETFSVHVYISICGLDRCGILLKDTGR
jgi:hypothetical protein